jgi:DnaK suppressor protein
MERKPTKKAASAAANAAATVSAAAAAPDVPDAVPPTPAAPVAAKPSSARVLLTEEQLIAQPARDYMNEGQLAFFRDRLRRQKEELLANVRDTSEHLRETEATSDVSDRATQEEEQALELRTRDRERKLLKKIEEALQRIDEGAYGYCAETGEPIGVRRLLARPTATLTIEAQERRERMQRMYGD